MVEISQTTDRPLDLEAMLGGPLPLRPYPGLRPFNYDEWTIFFGRETIVEKVIDQLVECHVIVVHGSSGSGKSSLIRADVLPRLEQSGLAGGAQWRVCSMMPRNAPLDNLAIALAGLDRRGSDSEHVTGLRRLLNRGADAPEALAEALRRGDNDHICILFDQFEELFAHAKASGPLEALLIAAFLNGLRARRTEGIYAAVTMRSEYLGECAQFPGLAETVNSTQYLLPQIDEAGLVRTIREPAKLFDGTVTRELADRLIADASGEQDRLPLLQHAVTLLYQRKYGSMPTMPELLGLGGAQDSPGWRLTLADYPDRIGVRGLLSEHAEEVYGEAVCDPATGEPDPTRGAIVEHLFRALSDANPDGQAVRRPMPLAELVAVTGGEGQVVRDIIDTFRKDGASFLKPYGDKPLADEEPIDVSHEALLRCWSRITEPVEGWLHREFEDGLVWRSLAVQARAFELDPNARLDPATTEQRKPWFDDIRRRPAWARRYLTRRDRTLSVEAEAEAEWRRVCELMDASVELWEAERKRLESAHDTIRRQKRIFRSVAPVLAVAATIGGSVGWDQYSKRISAVEEVAEQASILKDAQGGTVDAAAASAAYNEIVSQASEAGVAEPIRIYVHVSEDRRGTNLAAGETLLEESALGERPIIVPGKARRKPAFFPSSLRCFNPDDCNMAPALLELAKQAYGDNSIGLGRVGPRYQNANPGQFELWLGDSTTAHRIKLLIAKNLDIPLARVTGKADIVDDLGAEDSQWAGIIDEAEKAFGREVPDENWPNLRTVGGIIAEFERPTR